MTSGRIAVSDRTGLGVVLVCSAVWLAGLALTVAASPAGARVSADPQVALVPHWAVLLPVVVGIGLALLLPPRRLPQPIRIRARRPFTMTTGGLFVLGGAFVVAAAAVPLEGEAYVLAKLVLLMLAPAVLLLAVRGGVRIERAADAARWWAPAVVIAVWVLLSQVAPWNPAFDLAGLDPGYVVVAALATALTAGLGEELFFRRWLQTRLEAALGAWPGVALASLAFALMHLGSHGSGQPVLDVARVVVVQGSFGVFVGVLWWRYRNLVVVVLVHVLANGWAVAAALLPA